MRKRKKIKSPAAFLKSHPDFLKDQEPRKEEVKPTNHTDSAFLDQWWLLEYKWRDENNMFNHIY